MVTDEESMLLCKIHFICQTKISEKQERAIAMALEQTAEKPAAVTTLSYMPRTTREAMHPYLRCMKKKKEERPVKVPWKYFPIWKYQHLISSLTSAGLKDASSNPPAQNKLHKNFLNLIYA